MYRVLPYFALLSIVSTSNDRSKSLFDVNTGNMFPNLLRKFYKIRLILKMYPLLKAVCSTHKYTSASDYLLFLIYIVDIIYRMLLSCSCHIFLCLFFNRHYFTVIPSIRNFTASQHSLIVLVHTISFHIHTISAS